MSTNDVCIRGVSYSTKDVLVLGKTDLEEPSFGMIENIYVVEHMKFFEIAELDITDYNPHINAFECMKSNRKLTLTVKNLIYKYPQTTHHYQGKLHVMLYNVDFSWSS